jgi:hypothetical protein
MMLLLEWASWPYIDMVVNCVCLWACVPVVVWGLAPGVGVDSEFSDGLDANVCIQNQFISSQNGTIKLLFFFLRKRCKMKVCNVA